MASFLIHHALWHVQCPVHAISGYDFRRRLVSTVPTSQPGSCGLLAVTQKVHVLTTRRAGSVAGSDLLCVHFQRLAAAAAASTTATAADSHSRASHGRRERGAQGHLSRRRRPAENSQRRQLQAGEGRSVPEVPALSGPCESRWPPALSPAELCSARRYHSSVR